MYENMFECGKNPMLTKISKAADPLREDVQITARMTRRKRECREHDMACDGEDVSEAVQGTAELRDGLSGSGRDPE